MITIRKTIHPATSKHTNEKTNTTFCSHPFNFARLKIAVPADTNINASAINEIHIFIIA